MRRLNSVTYSDAALSCAFDGRLLERAREVPIVWHAVQLWRHASKRTNHNCRRWTQCLNADLTRATGQPYTINIVGAKPANQRSKQSAESRSDDTPMKMFLGARSTLVGMLYTSPLRGRCPRASICRVFQEFILKKNLDKGQYSAANNLQRCC